MHRWFDRFRRLPSEEEFAQELQSHLAHVVDEEVERGIDPQAARYAALRKFGNVTRHVERFHEASPWFWLETLWHDVRDGWRSLWRTPGLTSILILSLALGVGANAAVLLATRTLLFHPMPVPDPDRVFFLGDADLKEPLPYGYREQLATLFEPLGDIGNLLQDTVVVRLEAERLLESAVWASEGALRALGFAPQVGRWPSRTEHDTGAPVVVLSDRFGGNALAHGLMPSAKRCGSARGISATLRAGSCHVPPLFPPPPSLH